MTVAPTDSPSHDLLDDAAPMQAQLSTRRDRKSAVDHVMTVLPALLLFAALIGIWQAVAVLAKEPVYILPTPVLVLEKALFANRTDLLTASKTTIVEILVGFSAAVVVGFIFACLIVSFKVVSRAVYPLIIASQTIPILAIAPILVIWFGFGITSKIAVVILFAFFPVTVNAIRGMMSIDRDARFLMTSIGGGRWDLFRRVQLPASLPNFFTGAKQAAVISVIGAIVAEWIGSDVGLGPLMLGANNSLNTAEVFAAILYASIMAIGLFLVVTLIERLSIRWYFATGAGTQG